MVGESRQQLQIEVIVKDHMSRQMRVMGGEIEKFEKTSNRSLKSTGAGFDVLSTKALSAAKNFGKLALAAAALGAAYTAYRGATEFGKTLAEISTIVDTQRVNMGQLSDEILRLSATLGQDENVFGKGVYQALSSGIEDANEALGLTGVSAKLAVAGVAQVSETVSLLTSVLSAYNLEAGEAARISDILFRAVQLGKTTVPELKSAIGKILPVASQLGVSFEEVAAAVTTLTLSGVSTSEAATQVRGILSALLRNAEDIDEAMRAVGGSFSTTEIGAKGLVEVLLSVDDAAGGTTEGLLKMLGEIEAVSGASGLLANDAARLRETIKSLQGAAGATEVAFKKQMGASVNVLSNAINAARITAVKFGGEIIDMLARVVQRFQGSANLTNAFEKLGKVLGVLGEATLLTVENALNIVIDTLDRVFEVVTLTDTAFTKLGSTWDALPIVPLVNNLHALGDALGLLSDPNATDATVLDRLKGYGSVLETALNPLKGGPTSAISQLFSKVPEEAEKAGEEAGQALTSELEAVLQNAPVSSKPLIERLLGPGSAIQDAVRKAGLASKLGELRAGLDFDTLGPIQREVQERQKLIDQRLEEARAAFKAHEIDSRGFALFLGDIDRARAALAEFRTEREREAERDLEYKVRLRLLEGDDSLEAQLAKADLEGVRELTILQDQGASAALIAAVQARLAADRQSLIAAERRKDLDERDAQYRQEAADASEREAQAARLVLQARQDEVRAFSESERLRAALEGGIDGQLRLIGLGTKEKIAQLEQLRLQGVLTAEAFRELFGIIVEIGERDRIQLFEEAALDQAQLAADAVALVTGRLEDRLAAIRAADAVERDRAEQTAKQYLDEAGALESLNAQIDAQTAALVQQEVVRERERSGEEIQRWNRVREAIAQVNDEVAAGNITLSERQMVLIETIRQMEVEANTLRNGLQAGFTDFHQHANNLAQQGQRAASDIAFGMSSNLGDAIFQIGKDFDSAGDAAEEFARRTLDSIAQIAAQLAALQIVKGTLNLFSSALTLGGNAALAPLGTSASGAAATSYTTGTPTFAVGPGRGFQYANGGIAPGGLGALSPVYGYANGGPVVRSPHTALIGEGQYNEAIVPLPDGRSIPVEMRAPANRESATVIQMPPVNVSVTVQGGGRNAESIASDPKFKEAVRSAVEEGLRGSSQSLRSAVRNIRR